MIIWIKSSLNFLCVVHSLFPPPLRAAALCCCLVCMVGAPCYVLFCLVWSVWVWSACMCHLFSVWLSVMVLRGGGRQRINSRISNTGKDSMAAKWNTAFLLDCESGCWRSAAPVLKWLGRGQSQGGRELLQHPQETNCKVLHMSCGVWRRRTYESVALPSRISSTLCW